MTIFYCVQIEKSAHGKILSCEATNGGEADTSQKVSRNYRLRGPALHMDHWSCLRNFAKFYRVRRIPLPSPCLKHLVITISQLRIYEDTMLWAGWQKVKMCFLPRFYTQNCLSRFKCAKCTIFLTSY